MSRVDEPTDDAIPPPDRGPTRRSLAGWEVPAWLGTGAGWSWRLLLVGALLYFALQMFVMLWLIVLPLLVGLFAAGLLGPLKSKLTDLKIPSLLATWVVLLLGLGIVVLMIVGSSVFIGEHLAGSTEWEETRDEVRNWLRTGPLDLSDDDVDDLEARAESYLRSGTFNSQRVRLMIELIGASFLALVLSFFFIKDGDRIWSWLVERIRAPRQSSVDRAGRAAFDALRGYIRGVAITGVIDAVLIGAVLVVLDVPLAVPLAVLTFFAAFLPIVGATIAGALSALVALVANGPRTAIIVAVATLIIQQVEGDVVMPMVMRRTINLHPVVVLTALAIGGTLGGIAGAFVSVPVAAMSVAMGRELRADAENGRAASTGAEACGASG